MRKAALRVQAALACSLVVGVLAAPAAGQSYVILYDHYLYAAGGSGSPLTESGALYSTPYLHTDLVYDGPAADNWAAVSYYADLPHGAIGSYAYATGDVTDTHPFGYTATGRVNQIQFEIDLYFDVPAGTYAEPVIVSVSGVVDGSLSSTLDAGAKVHYLVTFSETFHPPLREIGIDEAGSSTFSDPFSLDAEIVHAGTVLAAPRRYTIKLTARIEDNWTWAVLGGTSPDYHTGNATVDVSNGLQFTNVTVPSGVTWTSVDGVFLSAGTGVATPSTPGRPVLHQNSPNPFNPVTTMRFDLPRAGAVKLRIYDLAGRLVRTLVDGDMPAGGRAILWNGRDDEGGILASGVYLGRLETADGSVTRKMVLSK